MTQLGASRPVATCYTPPPAATRRQDPLPFTVFSHTYPLAQCVLVSRAMRQPRRVTLARTGHFHKMWRGHNREPVLESETDKASYLGHLCCTYTNNIRKSVDWHSYCLMPNHTHECGRVGGKDQSDQEADIKAFGDWMRNAHSRFGAEYNRRNHRQGKVAYDRPKTTEVDDDRGVLTAMFYGDANPVRAGLVSHPSRYRHSSYRFYAYGEKSEVTAHLTPPPAYLALGKTPKARQRKYRQLCDAYLRQVGLINDRPSEEVDEPVEARQRPPNARDDEVERSRGHPPEGGEHRPN